MKVPASDWTPEVQDIANVLRSRTTDDNGVEVGTFNATTRPTETEVTGLIANGVSDVVNAVGADIPAPCQVDARYVAAISVAMLVELGYFPEQIGSGRSPYNALKDQFDDRLKRLAKCIENTNSGNAGGSEAVAKPVGSFPMTGDPFIIGRRTAW
jgi:hypothetical protein